MTKNKKQVVATNEIAVKISEVEVTLIKNSNTYKVDGELKYLSQIIWDEATDSIVEEIEDQLTR